MSVLECDIHSCGNIMCSRYSKTDGYRCEKCFHEWVMVVAKLTGNARKAYDDADKMWPKLNFKDTEAAQ